LPPPQAVTRNRVSSEGISEAAIDRRVRFNV
jgi:hypothetical protein